MPCTLGNLFAVLLGVGSIVAVAFCGLLPHRTNESSQQKPAFAGAAKCNGMLKQLIGIQVSNLAQVLHHTGDDTPGSTTRSNGVLVRHGEQVTLLDGKLSRVAAHVFHVLGHLVIALCLLRQLGL